MPRPRILFVTGRLAEHALREVLGPLSREAGFDYEVAVLGISVAALMHTDWVARHLPAELARLQGRTTEAAGQASQPSAATAEAAAKFDRIILPGLCGGELKPLEEQFGIPVERGPDDVFDLPEFFGKPRKPVSLDAWDIEIIAEINHAPRLSFNELLQQAERYRADGADMIDVGCIPGESWQDVGAAVKLLVEHGFRVSIDSFDRREVEAAVEAGAELVFSVNTTNVDWASKLRVEVVAIPDSNEKPSTLNKTVDTLELAWAKFRIDPILDPLGHGFAEAIHRYRCARNYWPDYEILMGVGNLTEMSEVDSAGVNFVLAALCQDLGIRSVLTTEVANWCRSSVREWSVARRMVKYAVEHKVVPKHLGESLRILRDARLRRLPTDAIERLAEEIRDPNFRLLLDETELHVLNGDGHWRGTDPFELFDRILQQSERGRRGKISAEHAFYLGYEMCKAVTALTLGKNYTQDQPLDWGFLTRPEISAAERRRHERSGKPKKTQMKTDSARKEPES